MTTITEYAVRVLDTQEDLDDEPDFPDYYGQGTSWHPEWFRTKEEAQRDAEGWIKRGWAEDRVAVVSREVTTTEWKVVSTPSHTCRGDVPGTLPHCSVCGRGWPVL